MAIVGEHGDYFTLYHYGGGYSTGPTETIDHYVIPGFFSVHVGLSLVQATDSGPMGAAIGIMQFGGTDFGPDPVHWAPMAYGNVGRWTLAVQVTKGNMTAWEFFQTWA